MQYKSLSLVYHNNNHQFAINGFFIATTRPLRHTDCTETLFFLLPFNLTFCKSQSLFFFFSQYSRYKLSYQIQSIYKYTDDVYSNPYALCGNVCVSMCVFVVFEWTMEERRQKNQHWHMSHPSHSIPILWNRSRFRITDLRWLPDAHGPLVSLWCSCASSVSDGNIYTDTYV